MLAQANLDRGGTVDESRRAKTPLPVTEPRDPGKDLADAQRRQRSSSRRSSSELLAQAREVADARARAAAPRQPGAEEPAAQPSGRDLADLALAAMRLQAQIDRQIDEYQKRPRKKFIGARAAEYRFAQYEEDWRAKVERIGTRQLPGRGARQALRQPAADGDHPRPTAASSRSSSTAPRASRCSTPPRSGS